MNIQPYLFFDGRCEEALQFYKSALGAEVVMLSRFKDSPDQGNGMIPPGSEDKIMHLAFRIGDSTILASDGECMGKPDFQGFSLTINTPDDATAERLFAALAETGQVSVPLAKSFFSSRFGMVADRFGVGWIVLVTP